MPDPARQSALNGAGSGSVPAEIQVLDEEGRRDEGTEGQDGNKEESGLLNGTEGCGPRKAEFAVMRIGSTAVYYNSFEARRHIPFYHLTVLQRRQLHLS